MRDGSSKTGDDPHPESAGVSKGRRHNVRAPARPDDADLHEDSAPPTTGGATPPPAPSRSDSSSPDSPPGNTNEDDLTKKR